MSTILRGANYVKIKKRRGEFMQQTTITLKTCEETKRQMIEFFEDLKREKTPPYAIFQAKDGDTVVTLYESGKAVFQGKDADLYSAFWIET